MADSPADGARADHPRPELVAVDAPDVEVDGAEGSTGSKAESAAAAGRVALDMASGAGRALGGVAADLARSRRWMVRDTPNGDRLRAEITQFTAGLPGLVSRSRRGAAWTQTSEVLAVGAAEALGRGDAMESWSLLWAAEREAIDGLRPEEVRASAVATVDAARGLLEPGAVTAAKKEIAGIDDVPTRVARAKLREARLLVDRLSMDVYRRLHHEARRISAFAVLTVVFLAAGAAATLAGIPSGDDGGALSGASAYLTVVTFGAAGAVLSLVLPWREKTSRPALLDFVNPLDLMVLRIAMGAAIALIFVAVLQAGVQSVVQIEGSQAYPWALAAGFSERLLDRRLAALDAEARDLDSH
jgi:hypothetical protein